MADIRRQQLEMWRNEVKNRKLSGSKNQTGDLQTASQRFQSENPDHSNYDRPSARTSQLYDRDFFRKLTPTKMVFQTSNVKPQRCLVGEKKPVLKKPVSENDHGSVNKRAQMADLRDRLGKSAQKRTQDFKRRRFENEKKHIHTSAQKIAFDKDALARLTSEDDAIKQRSVKMLVKGQMVVVDAMLEKGKTEAARDFLRSLYQEVKECTSVGGFWCRLADIEIKLGNIDRACHVFIHGLKYCKSVAFLEKCSNFLEEKMLSAHNHRETLTSLLQDPSKVPDIPDKDHHSETKPDLKTHKSQKLHTRTNSNDEQESLVSGDEAHKSQTKNLGRPERVPTSVEKSKRSSQKADTKPVEESLGTFIHMAAVNQKRKSAQALLGNNKSLTPVRRSARIQKLQSDHESDADSAKKLKSVGYTYTPNPHLDLGQATADDEEEEQLV